MNRMKLLVFLALFIQLLLILGCKDKTDNSEKLRYSDDFEKEKIKVNIGKSSTELQFSFGKINTSKQERKWKEFKMSSRFKIGGIDNDMFIFPANINIDDNENIYVLDCKDCSVKKFDRTGKFIKKYGKKGRGPGEFTYAFYFDVFNDGKVAIINPNDNKFVVFDDNEFNEFKCVLTPGRLAFISPNEVVTFQFMDPLTHSPFQKIKYNEDVITDYQNILDKESFGGKDFGMLPFLIGDLHRYKSNNVVFISSIMGYVISFSGNGKINKAFKLIDDVNELGLEKKEGKIGNRDIVSFPLWEEYLFASSNTFGNNLFIFCNPARMKNGEIIVDIYSLTENKYMHSLLLKGFEDIQSMFLSDKNIYISKKNTEVEVFDYKIMD
jgi:hypothetical protein